MTNEFVNFEIAQKLKEKGYPQLTFGQYDMQSACYVEDGRFYENGCITEVSRAYTAPRISEVLKWLREEKKIHLFVEIADKGWYYTIYPNIRIEDGKLTSDKYILGQVPFKSHEEAEIGGIEYVLDKLI